MFKVLFALPVFFEEEYASGSILSEKIFPRYNPIPVILKKRVQ